MTTLVEVARGGVMDGVLLAPVEVRSKGDEA